MDELIREKDGLCVRLREIVAFIDEQEESQTIDDIDLGMLEEQRAVIYLYGMIVERRIERLETEHEG